jgi:hypothetical protein
MGDKKVIAKVIAKIRYFLPVNAFESERTCVMYNKQKMFT